MPNTLESSPLRKLSARVILRIAEFLSPNSKLAFCLTCRYVYSIIRTRYLGSAIVREAQGSIEARTRPWEVLELEYPDQLECHYCQDLHLIDKIHEYASLGPGTKGSSSQQHNHLKDKCWKINHEVRTARFIHPKFSFTVFRMIMKRYRQGKDYNKLLEYLAYRSGAVREGAQVKQVVATPKIVNDRLLMRIQTAYIVQPKGRSRKYLLRGNLLKCPHTSKSSYANIRVLRSLFQRFVALETVLVGRQEHIFSHQCHFCPTEFRFSLERFEGQGVVLFITKWQDLGTGLSPLDSDLPSVVGRRRNICINPRGKRLAYESPRDRFEGLAPGEYLQSVLTLNYEERRDLFRKNDSRLARFRRIWVSVCWPIRGAISTQHLF